MKIHHNTVKRAAAHGLMITTVELDKGGSQFEILENGVVIASASDPKDALDLAILALKPPKAKAVKKPKARKVKRVKGGDEESEGLDFDDEDDEQPEGRSVVKRVYKMRYKPHKSKCGDDISKLVSAHVSYKDDDGKMKTDQDKLVRFAKANGVWDPAYASLNGGMKRMNICNRLRGKIRRDKHVVVWPA